MCLDEIDNWFTQLYPGTLAGADIAGLAFKYFSAARALFQDMAVFLVHLLISMRITGVNNIIAYAST